MGKCFWRADDGTVFDTQSEMDQHEREQMPELERQRRVEKWRPVLIDAMAIERAKEIDEAKAKAALGESVTIPLTFDAEAPSVKRELSRKLNAVLEFLRWEDEVKHAGAANVTGDAVGEDDAGATDADPKDPYPFLGDQQSETATAV